MLILFSIFFSRRVTSVHVEVVGPTDNRSVACCCCCWFFFLLLLILVLASGFIIITYARFVFTLCRCVCVCDFFCRWLLLYLALTRALIIVPHHYPHNDNKTAAEKKNILKKVLKLQTGAHNHFLWL